MDFGDLIWVAVLLVQFLAWVIKGYKKRDAEIQGTAPEGDPAAVWAQLQQQLEDVVTWADDLGNRLVEQRNRVLGLRGSVAVFVEVLADLGAHVEAAHNTLATTLVQLSALTPDEALIQLHQDERPGDAVDRLRWAEDALGVIQQLVDWRVDPDTAELMADADATAAAFLTPVHQFAQRRGLPFPTPRAICAPTDRGMESVWMNLLPAGYPVMFVPDDFGEDLYRWPAVAHEVGHLLWRRVPGLEEALRAEGDLLGRGMVPPSVGGSDALLDAWPAWAEELFCDFVAVLQMGPSAVAGFIHTFGSPQDPAQVYRIADESGAFEAHPPGALRVEMGVYTLERMGFSAQARTLRKAWRAVHGQPRDFDTPLRHGRAQVDARFVLAHGREIIDVFYATRIPALAEFEVRSIPDLSMTPGRWRRVLKRAKALREGSHFTDDPRVVITAAIEARRISGEDLKQVLEHRVHQAIIGVGQSKQKKARAAPGRSASSASTGRDLIRDAILLEAVLRPRHTGGSPWAGS